mgnify:CR=1 FL=1
MVETENNMTETTVGEEAFDARHHYAARVKRPKRSVLERRENRIAFLFILVPLIGFLLFTFASICFSVFIAFTDYNVLRQEFSWVWFDNFVTLFSAQSLYSRQFANAILNTVISMLSLPVGLLLGLLCAVLCASEYNIRTSKFYRTLLYLPAVSSLVAVNIIWRYLFHNDQQFEANRGLINTMLGANINWLSEEWPIRFAIIIKNVWSGMGGMMILYYAGMMNISHDYFEAAELDGANEWHKFKSITLPMLSPVTFYIIITGVINGLQSYTDSATFANGSVYAQTVVYFIWDRGINSLNYGLASAASVFLSVVIMIITVVQFRVSNKWVFEM